MSTDRRSTEGPDVRTRGDVIRNHDFQILREHLEPVDHA
jgi:hypothetical protein